MRFDELILTVADDELRVGFHPHLTVLSGLAAAERRAFGDSLLGAAIGGGEPATLRYIDGTGRAVTVASEGGAPSARLEEDGIAVDPPLGRRAASGARATMVLDADRLGVTARPPRADEPAELVEARADLAELSSLLEEAVGDEQRVADLQSELATIDDQLRAARDGAARRAYAEVLASLERVRAEMATLESGTSGVDADRRLLAGAEAARATTERWEAARAEHQRLAASLQDQPTLDPEDAAALVDVPEREPEALADLLDEVRRATAHRDELDHRRQALAVATMPAPSELVVGELGLLDQDELWTTVESLVVTGEALDEVRISLGGLGTDEGGPDPVAVEELEAAHTARDEAEQAAESVRVSGVAGAGLGVAVAAAGIIGGTLLLVVGGLLLAAAVGTVTLILPRSRVAAAVVREEAALAQAGAGSYLGFHLRRVEATVDPVLRVRVEGILEEHRRARARWVELVGPDVDVEVARQHEDEIRAYNEALRSLGGAADELEELRHELSQEADPQVARAWATVADACAPYGIGPDDLRDPVLVPDQVVRQVAAGCLARQHQELDRAREVAAEADAALDGALLQLGFGTGDLPARLGALQWAVAGASEREAARADARPLPVVTADLERLSAEADRLRQPEWASVTAAEADGPGLEELTERQAKVIAELARARPTVDVDRLSDRQDALQRRVAALESRLDAENGLGGPGAVADMHELLLAHLTEAAQAGPHGDPVPVLLDEVFLRVPADRKWDLLDLVLRLAERHQLVYLSDDPFVAAWGRQQAAEGRITLLEVTPEPAI